VYYVLEDESDLKQIGLYFTLNFCQSSEATRILYFLFAWTWLRFNIWKAGRRGKCIYYHLGSNN